MSDKQQPQGQEIDALVRMYLERQEETVDARQILTSVRARLAAEESAAEERSRRPVNRPRWGLRLALTAAAILIAILTTLQFGIGQASAETLLREAQAALVPSADRCYRIDIEPSPALLEHFPLLDAKQEILWTRGDRFWIEVSGSARKWTWGRDDKDRVWLALAPRKGIRFEAAEVPEPIAASCSVRSLQLETLLQDVLQNFELKREPPTDSDPPALVRIRAELKPGLSHPTLKSALIEMDSKSKVIQKLTLWRKFRNKDIATVTFTLIDSQPQSDTRYQLEGHLDDDASILSSDRPLPLRLRTLIEHFGPRMKKKL